MRSFGSPLGNIIIEHLRDEGVHPYNDSKLGIPHPWDTYHLMDLPLKASLTEWTRWIWAG